MKITYRFIVAGRTLYTFLGDSGSNSVRERGYTEILHAFPQNLYVKFVKADYIRVFPPVIHGRRTL